MKKILIAAHKMTREMVEEYNVDYQAQLGLCISYLLENKEEKEMLDKEIRKELEKLEISEEEIQNAERILRKYSGINKEITVKLYEDRETRRAMKNRNMWDDKDFSLSLEERYKGKAECTISKQKLWIKADKIRIYFDVLVDETFSSTGHWIKIK